MIEKRTPRMLSIFLPHTSDTIPTGRDTKRAYLKGDIVSIKNLGTQTGITFLPNLEATDPDTAHALKTNKAQTLWPGPDPRPRRLHGRC